MYEVIDLDRVSFAEWLVALAKAAIKSGFKAEQLFEATGHTQWFSYYEKNMKPEDALTEAENDAKRFGNDYCD